VERIAGAVPLLRAMHRYGSPLLYVDGSRAYDIVDGGRQGSSASTPTGVGVLRGTRR
jgi:hypothetical protein